MTTTDEDSNAISSRSTVTTTSNHKQWTKHSTGLGEKLLQKMGWSEGQGLGRRQGMVDPLQVRKRADGLGLGAMSSTGSTAEMGGWNATAQSFQSVLEGLQQQHKNDEKSEKKKRKKMKKLRKQTSSTSSTTSSSSNSNTLKLATNKVLAGHARKMRQSKSLHNKSAQDMACIFGVGVASAFTPVVVSNDDETKSEEKNRSSTKRKREDDDKLASSLDSTASEQTTQTKQKKSKKNKKDKKKKKKKKQK